RRSADLRSVVASVVSCGSYGTGMAKKRSPSLTVEDIWYYYKLPILVGSAILILVVYLLATAPPHRTVVLNVVLIGGGIAQDRVSRLEQQATAAVATDPGHQEIAIMPLVTEGPLALDSAANIKFLALLAARGVDVVITDRQDFAAMAA